LVTLALAVCPAVAEQQPASPSSVVSTYCQLDFDGARTRSETFNKVDRMVLWHTEPGWDVVRVVRSYRIVLEKRSGTRVQVTVEYDVVGDVSDITLTKKPQKEQVTFALKLGDKEWEWRKDGPVLVNSEYAWRIESPLIPPHISVAYAVQHFSSLQKNEPSDDQEQIRRLLAELQLVQKQGLER
jgi:hypothetical protein